MRTADLVTDGAVNDVDRNLTGIEKVSHGIDSGVYAMVHQQFRIGLHQGLHIDASLIVMTLT